MATPLFRQTSTVPPAGSNNAAEFAGAPARRMDRAGRSGATELRTVYHQRPGRVVESPFNQDYLDKLSKDDAETTKHFYGYFTKLLVVSLSFRLRSPSLAEDGAQETLLRVLIAVRKGEIQFPERLIGFVRSVSDNVAKEIGRKNARFQQIPENNPEPMAKVPSAELHCITEEEKTNLRRGLDKMGEKDRTLLRKLYILEQDKDSICSELEIDRNTMRVRVFRALGRLRTAMREDGVFPSAVRKANAG